MRVIAQAQQLQSDIVHG